MLYAQTWPKTFGKQLALHTRGQRSAQQLPLLAWPLQSSTASLPQKQTLTNALGIVAEAPQHMQGVST